MIRTTLILAAAIFTGCCLYIADAAQAAQHHHHRHHHSRHHHHHHRLPGYHQPAQVKHPRPIQTWSTRVQGHMVRATAFRPGDHYRMVVGFSRHPQTVPHWAGARHRNTRVVAAINGNTWTWGTMKPTGTIRANGHWASRLSNMPAVGFKGTGT